MIGYDFDKTIYDGDCFIDFYFYCLSKRPYIILFLPYQLIMLLLYSIKLLPKKQLKQEFYFFMFFVYSKKKLVNLFWSKNIRKIKDWYLKQKRQDDIIISASPKFW